VSQDKYPRVTQAQFEIWMNNPVTKRYLQCLEWEIAHAKEDLKPTLDPANADSSHAYLFELRGTTAAFTKASDPLTILKRSEMYEQNSERAN